MINTDSPEWQTIKAWLLQQMAADSQALAQHGLDLGRTEYLRGRLSLAQTLLDSPRQAAPPPETPDYR